MLSRGITALLRPVRVRVAFRIASDRQTPNGIVCNIQSPLQRSFATENRATRAVGRPSSSAKGAVKTTRNPRTRSASSTKGTAKKTTASRKSKAKNPKAKKNVVKKATKELSPEKKAAREERRAKLKITEMRKKALNPPKHQLISAWNVYLAEKSAGQPFSKDRATVLIAEFRDLAPADREHYNHLAAERTQGRTTEFKRWLEGYTPAEIQAANRARSALRSNPQVKKGVYLRIPDDRAVKRPRSPYILFVMDRVQSGDFKGISSTDRFRLIAQEWKALDTNSKQKFESLSGQDRARYATEHKNAYGTSPSTSREPSTASA